MDNRQLVLDVVDAIALISGRMASYRAGSGAEHLVAAIAVGVADHLRVQWYGPPRADDPGQALQGRDRS
jgi:hypothetical protein